MVGNELRGVLARNIKAFRKHRDWSQEILAEKAGISVPFLSDIERCNKWPYPETLSNLAKALDVEVYELFRHDDASKSAGAGVDFTARVVKEILIAMNQAAENVSGQYLG
jgi:transcriptional regulator with XRE-family HTH domain